MRRGRAACPGLACQEGIRPFRRSVVTPCTNTVEHEKTILQLALWINASDMMQPPIASDRSGSIRVGRRPNYPAFDALARTRDSERSVPLFLVIAAIYVIWFVSNDANPAFLSDWRVACQELR